jgi:hypothetical protein
MKATGNRIRAGALVVSSLAVVWLGGAGGCGGDDARVETEFASEPYGRADCDTPNDKLKSRREIRLFVNPGVDAESTAIALQRFYRRYGLTFYRTQPAQVIEMPFAENLDQAAAERALGRAFPGVDLSDNGLNTLASKDPATFERLLRTLVNFQLAGVVEFIRGPGRTGKNVTNVVLMQSLFSSGSPQEERDAILGLSMSFKLVRELLRTGMDGYGFFQLVDFPLEFNPVIFLSQPNVTKLEEIGGPVQRDLVAGHEFGHSAGLVHQMDKANLMYPSTDGMEACDMQILDAQIAVMRAGLELPAAGQARIIGAPDEERPAAVSPSLVARIVRGDRAALRAFLSPLNGDPTQR